MMHPHKSNKTAFFQPKSSGRKPQYIAEDPLLSATEAAIETGRGLSTFWRDVRAGRLPLAYYVTPRCPRWRRSELRAAVNACRRSTV